MPGKLYPTHDLKAHIVCQTSDMLQISESLLLQGPEPRGVLSLKKGTDCGPTAAELWLLRAKIDKKEGLSSHYKCA